MALLLTLPSRQVLAAYRRDVSDLTGYQAPAQEEFHVRVDSLGLEEVAAGAGMDSVSRVGSHFFAAYQGRDPISCEMAVPELSGSAALRSLVTGAQAEAAIAAIRIAQDLKQVQTSDYELRLLVIPGLLLEALRLRSLAGRPDLVLPLLTIYPALEAKPVFRADRFFAILRPKAARRLRFSDSALSGF